MPLDDVSIQSVLNLSEGGVVNDVGTDKHGWSYASGLEGAVGATAGSVAEGTASIVLRADGSGLLSMERLVTYPRSSLTPILQLPMSLVP